MTERIPCIQEGCEHTVLPTTAAKTGGYCMPCKQEMEREAHQRYIEANRRDVDLYEGITDAVDILKIMHGNRTYDPLIRYVPYKYSMEQVYLSLSAGQQDELKRYAMELIRSDDEDAGKDILLYLVCYHDLPLTKEIPELLEHELYYPAILYKSASCETREHLLQLVNTDDENRNHLLLMLAYIGDEAVVQQFSQWKQAPPAWASQLYVAPEQYALEAGWELTTDGWRSELFITPSYSLYEGREEAVIQIQSEIETATNSIPLLTASSNHCPWCASKLISLMNLHVKHPALQAITWQFPQLDVQTCLVCSSYGVVYMEMDPAGKPVWSPYNVKPIGFDHVDVEATKEAVADVFAASLDGSPSDEGHRRSFYIATHPRQPFHGSEWAMEPSLSQVGGHPGWVQDADYPVCPSCSARMKSIAQLDGELIQENSEGMYYMFICEPCQVTAVNYQQS